MYIICFYNYMLFTCLIVYNVLFTLLYEHAFFGYLESIFLILKAINLSHWKKKSILKSIIIMSEAINLSQ